jgi:DNA-binding cell septation regulator SpoVG
MEIDIKWFGDQFNVQIRKRPGEEEFLSIKGCRIVSGRDGEFIGWPSTKNDKSGKWWRHVWASEAFERHVLKLAKESQASQESQAAAQEPDDDIPF